MFLNTSADFSNVIAISTNQLTKEYIAKINTTGTKRDATFFLIAVYFNLPFSVFSSVIST